MNIKVAAFTVSEKSNNIYQINYYFDVDRILSGQLMKSNNYHDPNIKRIHLHNTIEINIKGP